MEPPGGLPQRRNLALHPRALAFQRSPAEAPATAAWRRLALNLPGIAEEREAETAAIWLAEHGHAIGARTPNLMEPAPLASTTTARASCSAASARKTSGNAFDIDAFRARVQEPIVNWLRGAALPPATPMAPAELGRHYDLTATRLASLPELRHAVAITPGPFLALARLLLYQLRGPGGRPW